MNKLQLIYIDELSEQHIYNVKHHLAASTAKEQSQTPAIQKIIDAHYDALQTDLEAALQSDRQELFDSLHDSASARINTELQRYKGRMSVSVEIPDQQGDKYFYMAGLWKLSEYATNHGPKYTYDARMNKKGQTSSTCNNMTPICHGLTLLSTLVDRMFEDGRFSVCSIRNVISEVMRVVMTVRSKNRSELQIRTHDDHALVEGMAIDMLIEYMVSNAEFPDFTAFIHALNANPSMHGKKRVAIGKRKDCTDLEAAMMSKAGTKDIEGQTRITRYWLRAVMSEVLT